MSIKFSGTSRVYSPEVRSWSDTKTDITSTACLPWFLFELVLKRQPQSKGGSTYPLFIPLGFRGFQPTLSGVYTPFGGMNISRPFWVHLSKGYEKGVCTSTPGQSLTGRTMASKALPALVAKLPAAQWRPFFLFFWKGWPKKDALFCAWPLGIWELVICCAIECVQSGQGMRQKEQVELLL